VTAKQRFDLAANTPEPERLSEKTVRAGARLLVNPEVFLEGCMVRPPV